MPLTTLKRFLSTPQEESDSWRLVWLLLQGISLHAVEIDRPDFDGFRKQIGQLQAQLNENSQNEDLFSVSSATMQLLGEYSQRASSVLSQRNTLLSNTISSLTHALLATGSVPEQFTKRLHETEEKLAHSITLEELQSSALQLNRCLEDLQDAASRARAQAPTKAETDEHQFPTAQPETPALNPGWPRDPTTKLPSELAARQVLEESLKTPGHKYLVVAVVNRIRHIKTRFGQDASDQVLKAIAQFIQSRLYPSDSLFRWRGPAFVALVERGPTIESIRTDIRRISQGYIERVLEIGGKRVLVPLSASWLVLPLGPTLDAITNKIDRFVASQEAGQPSPE